MGKKLEHGVQISGTGYHRVPCNPPAYKHSAFPPYHWLYTITYLPWISLARPWIPPMLSFVRGQRLHHHQRQTIRGSEASLSSTDDEQTSSMAASKRDKRSQARTKRGCNNLGH
jgi:hypothetical protein